MKKAAGLGLAVAALSLSPVLAFAAFTDLGVGARAPGMGNAFVAVADDVYAIHYNPAGLALLTRPELGTSYTRHLVGLSDASNLNTSFVAYAHPLRQGEWGTSAVAWQQFSLNGSLYQENSIYLSYARMVAQDLGPGNLFAGATLKHLSRSFGSAPEASNALNGLAATGTADPVLAGKGSVSAVDADLGALYWFRQHYALGLALNHVFQPNVAFSSADRDTLPLGVRLGLGYRSLLSNLGVEYDTSRSPIGTQDQRFTLAGERWFLRLLVGDFGLRGGLGIGNRDFKQLTMGLSYRTRRFQVDYGFSFPINTVADTAGTHRIGFSVRFGALAEPDESVEMIMEAMKRLKAGAVPEFRAAGQGLSPTQKLQLDEIVAISNSLQAQARYQEALDKLGQAIQMAPSDTQLLKNFGRLNFVAQRIKSLPEHKTDPVQSSLHQGIMAYLAGNEASAVEDVSYAFSLDPEHKGLEAFLAQLEMATGLKRVPYARATPERVKIEQLATQAANALEAGRYDEAIALSLQILKEDRNNQTAWENLGTAYFARGDYSNSLRTWEKAYSLEKNPARRTALKGYVQSIRRLMVQPRPVPGPAPAAERAKLPSQEIQKLYNEGVDYYTSGQLEKAKQVFENLLRLDPTNEPAAKALRRVKEEMSQR